MRAATRFPGRRAHARRPGTVFGHAYLYPTFRVDRNGLPTGGVEDGYVGQSMRPFGVRDAEHRHGKGGDATLISPWEDLAAPGSPVILESGWFTPAELDELEAHHIRRLQPRYNDRLNESRADRVRKAEARRHRDNRDVARGLVPRQWPPLSVDPTVAPTNRTRSWWSKLPVRWRRRAWWALGWLTAVHTLWITAVATVADQVPGVPWQAWPVLSTVVVSALYVLRIRRRRNRRAAWVFIAVATVVALATTGGVS